MEFQKELQELKQLLASVFWSRLNGFSFKDFDHPTYGMGEQIYLGEKLLGFWQIYIPTTSQSTLVIRYSDNQRKFFDKTVTTVDMLNWLQNKGRN